MRNAERGANRTGDGGLARAAIADDGDPLHLASIGQPALLAN